MANGRLNSLKDFFFPPFFLDDNDDECQNRCYTYLLTYLLYDLNEKRKKKLFGDLDSLTHPLEPKNVDLFHFPWN